MFKVWKYVWWFVGRRSYPEKIFLLQLMLEGMDNLCSNGNKRNEVRYVITWTQKSIKKTWKDFLRLGARRANTKKSRRTINLDFFGLFYNSILIQNGIHSTDFYCLIFHCGLFLKVQWITSKIRLFKIILTSFDLSLW